MSGFNPPNQNNPSASQVSSFSTPAFGSTPPQQNLSLGSSITSGTSLFGSANAAVPQSNASFGSSTFGTSATDASKSTFGGLPSFSLIGNTAPAASAGSTMGIANAAQPAFAASGAAQPAFATGGAAQPAFAASGAPQPAFAASGAAQPTFGAATTLPTFGAAATQPTFGASGNQSAFGTASNQPTFGSATTQSTFGSATAQPTFGAAATQSTFGGAATQPTFGAATQPTFGATTQPTFGGTAASQPLSFGPSAPAQQQPQPSFGASAAAQPLSVAAANTAQPLSLSATTIAQTPLFSLTSTAQTPAFGSLTTPSISFGVPAATLSPANTATAAPALSFGAPSTTQTAAFGMTNAAPPILSFSASSSAPTTAFSAVSSAPSLSFGVSTAAQTSVPSIAGTNAPSLTFGITTSLSNTMGGESATRFGVPSSAADAAKTNNVSSSAATSAAPLSLFSALNTTTTGATTSSTSSLLFPLSSSTTATSTSGVGASSGFSWPKTTTVETSGASASMSTGLGGVDHSAVTTTKATANTITSVKEQPLPNEIQQTVIAFKEYVKTQKNLTSEVARSSAEPLTKLTHQIASLNSLILTFGSVLLQQKFTAEKIKMETIKSLNDYELAQKIKDSPVASEERILAVRKYFAEKISAFEESTKVLQEKIEYVYQHVITLPQENSLSADALKLIVKKLHDSFIVISAHAYKLHNDMQLLKVQYLTLRNQYIKDNSSISFSLSHELQLPAEAAGRKSGAADPTLEGPNPFSRSANGSFNSLLFTSQNRNFAGGSSKEWNVVGASSASNPFGVGDLAGNSLLDQTYSLTSPSANQSFNLQKPPFSTKRGKR